MDQRMLYYLHKNGKIPNWAYYQLNNEHIQKNYREQRDIIYNGINEEELIELVDDRLEEIVKDSLETILSQITNINQY